jgi:C4-dicarboxylate-binding protein DctP
MLRVFGYCLLLTLIFIRPHPAAADPVKLRISVQTPATDPFLGASTVEFKTEVERESKGSIAVEVYDKGRLYIDDKVLDAVKSGAIEIGVVGLAQITKTIPAAAIMEQPFMFNFEALVRAATSPDSEIRQLIDQATLQALGVRVLWWQTIGQQIFYTKGGDAKLPAQIKDRKIRAASATMANFVTNCGGVPRDVSSSKVHEALQDGTIDIGMISIAAVRTRDLWQVTKALTKTDHATIEFMVLINEKVWQSLTDEQRAIVTKAARNAERDTRARAAQSEAADYAFARSKGMTVYQLTAKEIAQWRACSADVFGNYLETGGELTQKLVKAYAKLRTQPCCSAGPTDEAFKGQ